MKLLLAIGVCMTLVGCIGAGDNSDVTARGANVFPVVEGIDLHGKDRPLPAAFDAPRNLVIVAFEREQQKDVNTWINALPALRNIDNTLGFYEIPLMDETNAVMRTFINNGMRSGIEEDTARSRTISVYTDRDAFTNALNMQTTMIYALLTDDAGNILWRTSGVADKHNIDSLRQKLQ